MWHYWTFGTDPEFFLVDSDSKPVPAHKLFDATKHSPLIDRDSCGSAYRDGFLVELNPTSSSCRESVAYNTLALFRQIETMAQRLGFHLVASAALPVNPLDLVDAPPDVGRFGCHPSLDAYSGSDNKPDLEPTHPYRYGGGHLHIGTSNSYKDNPQFPKWMKNRQQSALFIRMCDRYIGLPLTFWFKDDAQFQRRKWYGKAGDYRMQTYKPRWEDDSSSIGLEYRTPPPQVWNHPSIASFAMGTMRLLASDFESYSHTWDSSLEPDIAHAINTGEGITSLLRLAVLNKDWGSNQQLERMATWGGRTRFHPNAKGTSGWDSWRRNRGFRVEGS